MATPQTRDAPQTPVSQGKREMLGERPGQLSHLPPPSAGTAPTRHGWAYILPCRGRAAGRSCRLIIRHTFFERAFKGTRAGHISSQNEDTARTGAVLPAHHRMNETAAHGRGGEDIACSYQRDHGQSRTAGSRTRRRERAGRQHFRGRAD